MKQVMIKKGNAVVEEVPAPCAEPGMVLVRIHYSCISVGTEMSSVRNTAAPLWKRAMEKPEQVKKAMTMMSTQGIKKTRQVVEGRLQAGNAVGYSAAGIVEQVGPRVTGFHQGDSVACAGAGYASHAEIINVPSNLVVKTPDNLDLAHASSVALGAIAMQGIRRAAPTLGETFVVLGLGILGQLAAQLLKNNGCTVIGVDLDPSRGQTATELGMAHFVSAREESAVDTAFRLTDGYGADGVIITAASQSSEVVSSAFKMCRRKGRVVLVGDVGLNLNRGDIYQREIDFLISTSYGPGRYDPNYEEKGQDYPIGYVRWTETRNMEHFIRLLTLGMVKIGQLIHKVYSVGEANSAYQALKTEQNKPLMLLLSYPAATEKTSEPIQRVIRTAARGKGAGGNPVRLAVIGAGGFAKGMHLPNIREISGLVSLSAVVDLLGHNAKSTADQYGADYAGTDYHDILNDERIDAVLITTRHHLHAPLTLDFLEAGKSVFVEKPLATRRDDLQAIETFFQTHERNAPILQTGFNRRFSPFAKAITERTRNRTNSMIINYRMNAGHIPLDHWVHSDEGGGRNIGEACHIYDLFTYFTDAEVTSIKATPITPNTKHYSPRDNFVAIISFADGSVATLTYTALGSQKYPKELVEIYVDGQVLALADYKKMEYHGYRAAPISTRLMEKGHREELKAFFAAIRHGKEWPIPMWQQVQATEIAFRVEELLTGQRM